MSSVETLRKRAKLGDLRAQTELGLTLIDNQRSSLIHKQSTTENNLVKFPKEKARSPAHSNEMLMEGIEWLLAAAGSGDELAQYNLGYIFSNEEKVQDEKKAIYWYAKAASGGDKDAYVALGMIYERLGQLPEAIDWYKKGTAEGDKFSQYALGECYRYGDGVAKDISKTVHYWTLSAENGFAEAQFMLGIFFARGEGVKKDYEIAEYWIKNAAQQGMQEAYCILGYFCDPYADEDSPRNSRNEAFDWYKKGALEGSALAQLCFGIFLLNDAWEENLTEAKKWIQKAAEGGEEEANILLIEVGNQEAQFHADALIQSLGSSTNGDNIIPFPNSLASNIGRTPNYDNILKELLKTKKELHSAREELSNLRRMRPDSFAEFSAKSPRALLDFPEIEFIEFKQSFSLNVETKKCPDPEIRYSAIKEMAAFLNCKGGVLLIGVHDKTRELVGLKKDIWKSADNYTNTIMQTITSSLGPEVASSISIRIHEIDGKHLCQVNCPPSPVPVYVDFPGKRQTVFMRCGDSSLDVPPKVFMDYCKRRFN